MRENFLWPRSADAALKMVRNRNGTTTHRPPQHRFGFNAILARPQFVGFARLRNSITRRSIIPSLCGFLAEDTNAILHNPGMAGRL